MVASSGRLAIPALALLVLTVSASTVLAQGNSFNPYGNSGYADYREFGSPMYSNNPSLPGQSRLNDQPIVSRPRANSFQQFSDGLEDRDADQGSTSASRASSAGVPYYRAYRSYDKEFNRVYRANSEADKTFDDRYRQRDKAFAKALEEKDPVKRARLIRQLEQDSLERPTAPRTKAAKPATPAAGTAPAPPTTTRRATAPASGTAAPRTVAPGSLGRAPLPPGSRAATTPRTTAPSTTRPVNPSIGAAPDPSTIAIPPPR